jgi:hypothetical protein
MVIAEMTHLQGDQVEITLTVEQERTLLQTIVRHLKIVKHQTVNGCNRLISPFSFFSRYHYSLSVRESVISLSYCFVYNRHDFSEGTFIMIFKTTPRFGAYKIRKGYEIPR